MTVVERDELNEEVFLTVEEKEKVWSLKQEMSQIVQYQNVCQIQSGLELNEIDLLETLHFLTMVKIVYFQYAPSMSSLCMH